MGLHMQQPEAYDTVYITVTSRSLYRFQVNHGVACCIAMQSLWNSLMITIRHQQQPLGLADLSAAHTEDASKMAQNLGAAGCSTRKIQTGSMLTAAKWLQNTHAQIHSCHSRK